MADSFINGKAVAGIHIHSRKGRTEEVPPGPRAEGVDKWVEVVWVHEGQISDTLPPISLHLHAGSARTLIRRIQEAFTEGAIGHCYGLTVIRDGTVTPWSSATLTKELALELGTKLVNEQKADFFRIDQIDLSGKALESMKKIYNLSYYSCGYCQFEGLVSSTGDWTRCPNCGGL